MGPQVGRRAVLTGAALLPLAAACTSEPAPVPAPPDPDDLLREQAAQRERALLAEYDAVLLAVPALGPRLLPLRAQHAEHLVALTGPAPSTSPSPTPSPSDGPLPPEVPPAPSPAASLAALVAAEQSAGGAHAADAVAARSRELAGLLASLAASESSHTVALA